MCCCCLPRCSIIFAGVWCLVSTDHKQMTAYYKKVSLPINVISMEFNIDIEEAYPQYFQLFQNFLLQSRTIDPSCTHLRCPPSGAINRLPTIVNCKFFNPNVFESLVITAEATLSQTYTPLLTFNPFISLFTV